MRLQELTIYARDLETARRFYCGVLGLREMEPRGTGRLIVQVGRSRLVIQPARDDRPARYHFAFDVPRGRFDAADAWLHARGGPISAPSGEHRFHSENWNADSVYFRDPEGNILELIARYGKTSPPAADQAHAAAQDHAAGLNIERPFAASEIIGITELGISADSVVDTVAMLLARLPGVTVYDGAGSDMFTAVGDEDGLLIVVHRGRIWFPNTGVPAENLPLEVLVEVENGQRCLLTAPPYPIRISPQT